ncbi:MAG: protein-export chaperone SecB [Verrucomicrobia bacterium]|nr:protein-export chaperone SecB [Verrucomicrobiota bacterium]MCH8528377.1 protein-export chaperone SecB [Kiritimatiellia bacterium]
MQPSALGIELYFVAASQVFANPAYDGNKASALNYDALQSEVDVKTVEGEAKQWQVHLTVAHHPVEKENAPYDYSLQLIGFFSVSEQIPADKRQDFAKVNGASVLFGIAREHLRVLTSAGPYPAIHLPAVSFVDLLPQV